MVNILDKLFLAPKRGLFIPSLLQNLVHLVPGAHVMDFFEILYNDRPLSVNKGDNSEYAQKVPIINRVFLT